MVNFMTMPDEQEAVAQWSRTRDTVEERYKEIWDGVKKIPEGDNGESKQ